MDIGKTVEKDNIVRIWQPEILEKTSYGVWLSPFIIGTQEQTLIEVKRKVIDALR